MVMFSIIYPPWRSITEKQLEYFHGRIIIIQQEIILSGEFVSPTILLFQCMKALSKSDKHRYYIAPKMTDHIKLIDNNGKSDFYTGGDIHGIYCYLEMIGAQEKLTTSGQRYHH